MQTHLTRPINDSFPWRFYASHLLMMNWTDLRDIYILSTRLDAWGFDLSTDYILLMDVAHVMLNSQCLIEFYKSTPTELIYLRRTNINSL